MLSLGYIKASGDIEIGEDFLWIATDLCLWKM